jgi:hypothetical protein
MSAQYAHQTILLQFDKDVHFGDDATIILAKAGGDILNTVTLRVDWPIDFVSSTLQYSTGTAMIDRVELIVQDQVIERHYGESMFLLGEVTVPEAKQSALAQLVGTQTTSNLVSYFIQFPFTTKLPVCVLDEPPKLRVVFRPADYFTGQPYSNPVPMTLYVDYVYVTAAERNYLKATQIQYPVRSFQRVELRIPHTLTQFSCDTDFVNMVKELFWVILPDQYTSNIYNYSDDLVSMNLSLDMDQILTDDVATGQHLRVFNKHTRVPTHAIYCYSFEINPESEQENGSINMSSITRQRHVLTLTPSNVFRTLRIYAHSYNILTVEHGKARVLYPMVESGSEVFQPDVLAPIPPAPPLPLYVFYSEIPSFPSSVYFGESVAINDSGAFAISAPGTGLNTGAVITEKGPITSVTGPGSYFGYSVDISNNGNTVVVGAPAANNGAGAAFVYTFNGTQWILKASLVTTTTDYTFGWAVAISGNGNTIVVGAPRARGFAGHAGVFQFSGGTWSSETVLTSTATGSAPNFGDAVSISDDGTLIAVGAYNARYVGMYRYSGESWTGPSVLPTTLPNTANFGYAVHVSPTKESVIVGAPNSGYVGVYNYTGSSWVLHTQLTNTIGFGKSFGASVALSSSSNVAVVGAPDARSVAVYTQMGSIWVIVPTVIQMSHVPTFGSAVSITHDASKFLAGGYGGNKSIGYAAVYVHT